MSDYRNFPIPLTDLGLDLMNPRDKVVPGKWAVLTNAYPQKANILSQRKGFTLFFNQGNNAGALKTIFPVNTDVTFFSTDAAGGTIGISNPLVSGYQALSTGWGNYPTFLGSTLPVAGGFSPFIPYSLPPPGFPANEPQTWTFVSSSEKLKKFAYPPVDSAATLFSEFIWGLEPPNFTPTTVITAAAGGQDSSVSGAEPYTYVLTHYSHLTGAESASTPASAELNSTLKAIQINFSAYAGPFDLQYDAYRIYRKGGTQVSTYRLVDTISATSTTYTDNKSDDTLSTSLALLEDNFRPFVTTNTSGETVYGTSLPYIWGPFLGQYILACGDEVQPGSVFWTNAGRPDTMNPDNNLVVTSPQEPLLNGFVFGANTYVWTQQRLFALDYGGPLAIPTFVPREVPINMGLAAPFAFTVSSLGGVFFLGNDGIYVTDCQSQIESITNDSLRPIFRGEASEGFPTIGFPAVEYLDADGNPNRDIKLFASGQELHFVYTYGQSDTGIGRKTFHLVYNILQKSWREFELGIIDHTVTCGTPLNGSESAFLVGGSLYVPVGVPTDARTLILKYNNNDKNVVVTDAGSVFTVTAITGGFDMEIPQTLKEFGNVIVDADPNFGTITVTPIRANGTEATPQTITGAGRQRFPLSLGDEYDYFQSYKFSWPSSAFATLYNLEVLFRADQEVLKHWAVCETSFGNPGWQHLRDGYFCLRSTSDTTLVVGIDGTDYTYTLPSTGGEKRKVYVKFSPVKGKMFKFDLDATGNGVFRLYGDETQLNVKPWNTNLGYKPVYPFVAPGYAPFLRNEAGT